MTKATVTRETTYDGTFVEGKCPCGGEGSTYAQRGFSSNVPGALPGDWQCEKCGQWYNWGGDPINDPDTWSPYDAGESWDEE